MFEYQLIWNTKNQLILLFSFIETNLDECDLIKLSQTYIKTSIVRELPKFIWQQYLKWGGSGKRCYVGRRGNGIVEDFQLAIAP